MARIETTFIDTGDARDRAPINTNLAAFTTQSTNVDEDNVREGGLDDVCLDPTDLVEREGAATPSQDASSLAASGSYTELLSGSLGATGSFTVESGDIARLRAKIELPNSGAHGVPWSASEILSLTFYTNKDSGGYTQLTTSERHIEGSANAGRWGSVILEDVLTAAGDYTVKVYYKLTGATAGRVGNCSISVTVYKDAYS